MRALSLLFDPRGAIDRRTFWSGLLQLAVLGLAIDLGLTRLGVDPALAALPVVGDAFVIGGLANQVYGGTAPDVALTSALLIVVARYYVVACLMLKRSRHAGQGVRPTIAFGLVSLSVHGLMGLWAWSLYGEDMAVLVPMFADMAAGALVWTIFLGWLGSRRAWNPLPETRVFRSAQVKPAS